MSEEKAAKLVHSSSDRKLPGLNHRFILGFRHVAYDELVQNRTRKNASVFLGVKRSALSANPLKNASHGEHAEPLFP
jgi:hypothetical protein